MKAHLMYRDRDFSIDAPLPANAEALRQDLELTTLFDAMAAGDKLIRTSVEAALLSSCALELDTIRYRQAILVDCIENPAVVRQIYDLAGEAIENERRKFWHWADSPSSILHRSVNVLDMFTGVLKTLRGLAAEHGGHFRSDGFSALMAMLQRELGPDYFHEVEMQLRRLRFRGGILMSATLGRGNRGEAYVLRRPLKEGTWLQRFFGLLPQLGTGGKRLRFDIDARDESGWKARSELEDRGVNLVANALAQSVDHILSFLLMLRIELGFYLGAVNLRAALSADGAPVCMPDAAEERRLTAVGLYDACLALRTSQQVIANDIEASGKSLVVITGANRGGKTTFLRAVGLAQVMMQAGLFVPARHFAAGLCDRLLTHFRREEDATMTSGKFDEELARMDALADLVTPRTLFLFNESFAATNEREGAEVADQITSALLERGVRIVFVTHLYTFARGLFDRRRDAGVFLRAERPNCDEPSFKLIYGEPLQTSFGPELFRKIFDVNANKNGIIIEN